MRRARSGERGAARDDGRGRAPLGLGRAGYARGARRALEPEPTSNRPAAGTAISGEGLLPCRGIGRFTRPPWRVRVRLSAPRELASWRAVSQARRSSAGIAPRRGLVDASRVRCGAFACACWCRVCRGSVPVRGSNLDYAPEMTIFGGDCSVLGIGRRISRPLRRVPVRLLVSRVSGERARPRTELEPCMPRKRRSPARIAPRRGPIDESRVRYGAFACTCQRRCRSSGG